MTLRRKLIRAAVVATLKEDAALQARGVSHFVARYSPIPTRKLPSVSVYTNSDSVEEKSWETAPRKYERDLNVQIEVSVMGEEVADLLDDICEDVEQAIGRDTQLKNTCYSCNLSGTNINFSDDGEKKISTAILSYSAEYETEQSVPVAEADDLDTITASYRLSQEQQNEDLAEDLIDVSNP